MSIYDIAAHLPWHWSRIHDSHHDAIHRELDRARNDEAQCPYGRFTDVRLTAYPYSRHAYLTVAAEGETHIFPLPPRRKLRAVGVPVVESCGDRIDRATETEYKEISDEAYKVALLAVARILVTVGTYAEIARYGLLGGLTAQSKVADMRETSTSGGQTQLTA